VRWTACLPMLPASHLVPLAQAAEEAGFHTIAVPDLAFHPESTTGSYPYTPDGQRFWPPETPFVDPFVAIAAMAAVTERIGFTTNVLKLPLREPLLVAKQLASLAVLTGERLSLGVGLAWMPEEFAWTGTDKRTRGVRTDEAIDVLRAVCGGGGPRWVEHDGPHYRFGRLMISPAPERPVPIIVGGHSRPALRRAARKADGWISAMTTTEELAVIVPELHRLRAEHDRTGAFSISALAMDAMGPDGAERLAELGVTDAQVVPWYLREGDLTSLDHQRDSLRWWGETVIRPMEALA
jgi:probable F420-dependent oxidoreductase